MGRGYGGVVEFVRVGRGEVLDAAEREVVFGPRYLEVQADSVAEAEDKIRALAKSQWRPRKSQNEVMHVYGVRLVQAKRRTYYAFRYEHEGEQTARYKGYVSNQDYVPGQLFAFDSKEQRDEWVKGAEVAEEKRKPCLANRLPLGWRREQALDPETGELYW